MGSTESTPVESTTVDNESTTTNTNVNQKYSITWKNADGSILRTDEVEKGTVPSYGATPVMQPTAEFTYTFKAWDKEIVAATGDATYTATYDSVKNKYTYTFYDEDGTTELKKEENVEYGTAISAPDSPSKKPTAEKTFTFDGWYTDKTAGTKVTEFGTLKGNTAFYARYTDATNKYSYTFYNEDGSVYSTNTVDYGTAITVPSNPTKASDDVNAYVFDGWYTDATAGTKVTEFGTVTGNVSYYARFNKIEKIIVSFALNQGSQTFDAINLTYGDSITLPQVNELDGYIFDGWYLEDTYSTKYTNQSITKSITLYGKYVNAYTVTFADENGVTLSSSTLKEGEQIVAPTNPTKSPTAEYIYTFDGWYTDKTAGEKVTTFGNVAANVTYYARFIESARPSQTEETEGFGDGFTAWSKLEEIAGTTENSGKTVLAKSVTYGNFTFASNGKNRVDVASATNPERYSTQTAAVTIVMKSAGTIYISGFWGSDGKTGKVYLKNSAGTTVYESSSTISGNGTDISFNVAVEAGTYTLSSDATISLTKLYYSRTVESVLVTLTTTHSTADNIVTEKGQKITLPTLSEEGYIFLGWYTNAACTDKFDENTAITKDTELFAGWKVYDPNDYVTISFDEETCGVQQNIIIDKNTKVTNLPTMSKDGYVFKGWYTDAAFNTEFNSSANVTESVKLYAKFVALRTIIFKYADSETPISTNTIEDNEQIDSTIIPQPKYIVGKTFAYWSVDGTTEFNFETKVTANTTLIAIYTESVSTGVVEVIKSGGDQESLYAEFIQYEDATTYAAYVKESTSSTYIKLDNQLIRKYISEDGSYYYYRVDAVGLKASKYDLKIVPIISGSEAVDHQKVVENIIVTAHDRSGFAFSSDSPIGNANGAYNADGTLRTGAQVIYVTNSNAKTVEATVGGNKVTGLQAIIAAKQKASTSSEIIDIRIIGTIYASSMDSFGSSAEGLQIKGAEARQNMNMTVEGIGNDAGIHGFGILIRNCSNVELRNFAVMNCMDDSISVDTDNCNLWIHNLDLFYGQAGGDSDQAKGDGTIDIKLSQYITVSYNHYWDSGKASLLDASVKSSNYVDNITMHHNWFDHSDSRHPRIRNGKSIHVYNNYYDGVSKYGVGAAGGGSSAFVEANYFRNTKYPMLTSKQGSDWYGGSTTSNDKNWTFDEDGGVIKSFANAYEGTYTYIPYGCETYVNKGQEVDYDLSGTTSTINYDAYEATSRNEQVPSTVKSLVGNYSYSNFDTASTMYSYTADTAVQAKNNVTTYAGRVQGGDFKWTFDNATEDTNSSVISGLKTAVVNYTSKLVSVQGIEGGSSVTPTPSEKTAEDVIALIEALPAASSVTESDRTAISAAKDAYDALSETEQAKVTNIDKLNACIAALPAVISSGLISFNGKAVSISNGLSATATISGYKTLKDLSLSAGVSYNSTSYETAAKFDSKSSISITLESDATVKVYAIGKSAGTTLYVGTNVITTTASIADYSFSLSAGTYEIKQKSGETYVFLIVVE